MARRVCLDCHRIGEWKRGRCPDHERARERARGTTTERGYGAQHQRTARAWRAKVAAGELVTCWRCLEAITDPTDVHLGHDDFDRTITRGPEHGRGCNLSAAGKARHGVSPSD